MVNYLQKTNSFNIHVHTRAWSDLFQNKLLIMREIIILFTLLICNSTLSAQINYWDYRNDSIDIITKSQNDKIDEIVQIAKDSTFLWDREFYYLPTYVDSTSVFLNGDDAFTKFIKDNIELPFYININITVVVCVLVTENGEINSLGIFRGIDYKIDLAVIEVIKKMPNWLCAYRKGKAVNGMVLLPIDIN